MPIDGYFPALGFENQGATRDDFDRWLKFRAFQQQPTTYVAASNTPETLAYMAAFKCDGIDDDLTVQEAEASILDVGFGRRLTLLPGDYSFSGPYSVGSGVALEAYGASIDQQGAYTGTLLNSIGSGFSVRGGVWGLQAVNSTSPTINTDSDRIHLEDLWAFGGTGTSLEISASECQVSSCFLRHVVISGTDNTLMRSRVETVTINANAARNIILPHTLRYVTTAGSLTDNGDGTRFPPGHQLDYAEITADHALTGSEADVTGLETITLGATALAPRWVRVRAHFSSANDTAGGRNKFNLKTTGGTYLDEQTIYHSAANDLYRCSMEWQGKITADTAWEVRGLEISGQGKVAAATTWPAFIEVLDLGILDNA